LVIHALGLFGAWSSDKDVMLTEAQFRELVSGRWRGPLPAVLRGCCAAAEVPYSWVVRGRNLRFDAGTSASHRVSAPVVSVGNLTVGGTGKTPFVAWLARWFRQRDVPITLISRGYGSQNGRPNDEGLELAAQLPGVPHVQNADRVAAAAAALAANPQQVLILDDAFQHRRIARDLDIVVLDALEPFGHERLLPRGLLREPAESLARANVVALSRSDAIGEAERRAIEKRVLTLAPKACWLELVHQPSGFVSASGMSAPLDSLRGRKVAAFCGIGNPAGFRHTLAASGLEVVDLLALPDHCPYTASDLTRIERWAAGLPAAAALVCTRKDLVKLPGDTLAGKPLWAMSIELAISRGQADLEGLLSGLVGKLSGSVST
jgi:tetraacyldisaccharide 4'-kinase